MKATGNLVYIPVDHEALKDDVKFCNIITTLRGNFLSCLSLHDELKEKMQEVDQMIQAEIGNP